MNGGGWEAGRRWGEARPGKRHREDTARTLLDVGEATRVCSRCVMAWMVEDWVWDGSRQV